MLVDVYFEIIGHQSPLTNIKFALVVQKGLLNILLEDPSASGDGLRKEKLLYFFKIFEDLYTSALVKVLRLH